MKKTLSTVFVFLGLGIVVCAFIANLVLKIFHFTDMTSARFLFVVGWKIIIVYILGTVIAVVGFKMDE